MKRRTLALCLALLLLLTACGNSAGENTPAPTPTPPAATPTPTPTPTPEPTPEPTPPPPAGPVNPLTGEPIGEEWVNKRPIAVMLNNIKKAQPQLGVSQADIIYEVLAEGGITRMLGVYQSPEGVGTIGSIRSSRPYYLELALGHDAVYLHAGGSEDAYAKIKAWNVTALDCVHGGYEGRSPGSNLYWRDAERKQTKGYEHSVITTGETIEKLFPTYSFRQEHEEGYVYTQAFAEDGTPADGESATMIRVPFSSYKTGEFTYDAARKQYMVKQYGTAYIDGNSGDQVGVTNVIILRTACNVIPGDDAGRITVDLTSGGSGWFACGGKIIPIQWSKADRNSQFVYTDLNGNPITLGQGSTYVSIIPLQREVTYG